MVLSTACSDEEKGCYYNSICSYSLTPARAIGSREWFVVVTASQIDTPSDEQGSTITSTVEATPLAVRSRLFLLFIPVVNVSGLEESAVPVAVQQDDETSFWFKLQL